MTIETSCPNPDCQKKFKVADKSLGRTARCKHCNTRFRVQAGAGQLIEARSEGKKSHRPSVSPPDQIQPDDAATQVEPSHPEGTIAADAFDPPNTPDLGTPFAGGETPDPAALKDGEEDVPVEWNAGDVILDLYEVKQVHEAGAMELVYRVHHRNWNIDLALKSPRAEFFETEAQKEDFVREAETWIKLGLHPNTVSCYYVRRLGGIPCVFAEYVKGGSLKDRIEDERLYQGGADEILERILDTAIQFAWGLHYAHEQGLVHQDIKPDNVMMTENGTPKVRITHASNRKRLTFRLTA